jgi:hypothetical protein
MRAMTTWQVAQTFGDLRALGRRGLKARSKRSADLFGGNDWLSPARTACPRQPLLARPPCSAPLPGRKAHAQPKHRLTVACIYPLALATSSYPCEDNGREEDVIGYQEPPACATREG